MSVLLSTGEVPTMSGNRKWIMPALAGLVALIGCGGEPSVASKSAAAFEEAQKRGETFGGEGHAHGGDHGHGAAPSESPQQPAAGGEHRQHAGHGAAEAPAAGHEGMDHSAHGSASGERPADHSAMEHGTGAHAGHAPRQSGSTRAGAAGAGHEGHAGHGAPAAQAPADHSGHAAPADPSGHAGHSAPAGGTPSPTAPELPAQPAGILRPDPLDAPAATSVADAQRSEEMNQEMSGGHGGHGGHGAGTYRQIDAGRGPGAYEGSEPQTPGAGPQHHDHGAEEKKEAALYACPMHPEVTSKTPGTCPKCGMKLVERREE
jgi:hypothetical protein